MSPVKEADPRAKALDAAFAEAMDAPAKPREAATPPVVDHDAPHGRGEDGEPLAPFGWTKDGKPRKSAAGRKAKEDQPRTVEAQPAVQAPGTALESQDFSAGLMDAGETIWFGGSILAKVGPQVPVLGRFVPGRKLSATMAVFDGERPRLAAALNLAAQHDSRARKLAAKLATGQAGWALTVMFMVAPFASAAAAVWQTTDKNDVLTDRGLPALDILEKRNENAMDRMLAKISAQMEAAQAAQAQATFEAAMNGQAGA